MKKILLLVCLFLISITKTKAYYKLPVDPTTMTIEEINIAIDSNIITYTDLMHFYIDRINEYNKQYNAFITINENALEIANKKDQEFNKNGRTSPIFGMPIILKDNIDYVELPTTVGSKALLNSYPKQNAEVVDKLINAGAIIIGKANLSSFGIYASNSKSEFGHTYNAYNTDYSSYGSSGGVAVAIAGNLAVAGLGTDTNSSIRLPASANNLIGLRPTFNTISINGIVSYDTTRDVVGPITRYVSDNVILYNIISDNNIKYNKKIKNLRIGVLTQLMNEDKSSNVEELTYIYDEIKSLTENAISIFNENEIVYINNFHTSYYEELIASTYSGRTMCDEFNKYIINTTSKYKTFEEVYENSNIYSLDEYYEYCGNNYINSHNYTKGKENQEKYSLYVENIMDEYDVDVLIYPAMKTKIFKIEELNNNNLISNSYMISPTTGMPSIVVPMGFDNNNLPYGLEMVSKKNNEQILYDLAYYFEHKTNYYYNPDIAPLLYEIPENVSELIKIYQKNIEKNQYSEINSLVKNYFKNYNTINNIDKETNTLIEKYELKKERIKRDITIYLIICFILSITTVPILYGLFKK